MNKELSRAVRGDMLFRYEINGENRVGLTLLPLAAEPLLKEKDALPEPLIQLYVRGDNLPAAFSSGRTMAGSGSVERLVFRGQEAGEERIVTRFEDPGRGLRLRHVLAFPEGCRAAEIWTEAENAGDAPFTLEMLSSGTFGGLTPFDAGEAPDSMEITVALSSWSAEGRFVTESVENAGLEPSWARHGVRVKKIGVAGSMPVNGYFPFLAVHDRLRDVSWAAALEASSSWQMELRRKDCGLSLSGGLADYDSGHWARTLSPGETFRTPSLYLTTTAGDAEKASQRLLDLQERNRPKTLSLPPVMYNEYCTTWGVPSHENLKAITEKLRGRGFEYLVIDAGWYKSEKYDWSVTGGDWVPAEKLLFPEGFRKTADMIRDAGMIPGLWFESETCGPKADLHEKEEWFLTRNGSIVDTGGRRFLDMRKPEVQAYLDEKVIGQLKKYGFGYIKNDYNDDVGIGADDPDSLGEGLRQSIEGSKAFFRRLRREIPGLVMENCSSGGHRLEPSLMALFDMASFSDAHECVSIPIIAANLHRLILPIQSQIWAVLHGSDSLRRLHYSMVNTFLGAMCLSGDIYAMNKEQWALVDRDIAFYRKVRHLIARGDSRVVQKGLTSWSDPKGYQWVIRENESEALVTLHTFGGDLPKAVSIPTGEGEILDAVTSEGNAAAIAGGNLTAEIKANFEAAAFYIRKKPR